MICVRKCLYFMANVGKASFLEVRAKRFQNFSIVRAFSTQDGDDLIDYRGSSQAETGRWFTPKEVEVMSRRELQKWCKKLGIRANTKTIQMRADLFDFHQNVLSHSCILQHPFLPMQSSQTNNFMTSYAKQDKLLFNHNWIASTEPGLGQVRYFKNMPCPDRLYEDALFYSDKLELNENTAGNRLPSVSKVLRATAPKSKLFAISRWTKKQKELLGEDAFQHKMNEIKRKGSDFHNFVHRCLVDRKLNSEVPEKLQGYLMSTRKVFDKLGDAIASETNIRHEYLGYQGKLDTLACYDGNPCIIEWKTSQREKSSLAECGEYPMQMVAYAGAVNSDPTLGVQIRHGLLVIAYEDGSPADVHFMDLKLCRGFWQDWLVRLYQFNSQ